MELRTSKEALRHIRSEFASFHVEPESADVTSNFSDFIHDGTDIDKISSNINSER